MKNRYFTLLCFTVFTSLSLYAQDCRDKRKYENAMSQADSCIKAGNYALAQDFYNAAKVYCRDEKEKIEKAKDDLFVLINGLQKETEKAKNKSDSIAELNRRQSLTAYANDLAYKSQIALRDGDRAAAFRLAEFAHQFVDKDNPNVLRSIVNSLYYYNFNSQANQDKDILSNLIYSNNEEAKSPLFWASNLQGHLANIQCVAFSSDCKWLASGSNDNSARIWNLQSRKVAFTLSGYNGSIQCLTFSPDSKRLATGSSDNTIKIWDLENGQVIQTLKGHSKNIVSIDVSKDGKYLASLASDKKLFVWDLQNGNPLLTLQIGKFGSCIAFSPDCKQLAIGFLDNNGAQLWDLKIKKPIKFFNGHSKPVMSIVFSPDGRQIATASLDNTSIIWDSKNGKPIAILAGHSKPVVGVAYSPDGKQLATASYDNTARIWDTEKGRVVSTLRGHSDYVSCAAFSPDGKYLATGSGDKVIKIWDLDNSKLIPTLKGHLNSITSIAFSPDGNYLATGSQDNTAKIWDLQNIKEIITLKGHLNSITSITFSPDGNYLATGSQDNTAKIWDLQNIKEAITLKGHSNGVTSVAYSPDGNRLATGSSDNTAKIWDIKNKKVILSLKGHSENVNSISFSPDGRYLVTGSDDNTATIWDVQNGSAILRLKGHSKRINSVAFSSNGRYIATGSSDKCVKIWKFPNGEEIKNIEGSMGGPVWCVVFSPNCKQVAISYLDNIVKIWDLQSEKFVLTFEVHSYGVNCVSFSPNGNRIATGAGNLLVSRGEDNTSKILDIEAQNCITSTHKQNLASLNLYQLLAYGLEEILDQQPDNEAKLIANGEVWQIAAFADLYADKIAKSLPKKQDYERAKRLYQACLASGVEKGHFEAKIGALEKVWKERGE
jgi:WD40 repeat protein